MFNHMGIKISLKLRIAGECGIISDKMQLERKFFHEYLFSVFFIPARSGKPAFTGGGSGGLADFYKRRIGEKHPGQCVVLPYYRAVRVRIVVFCREGHGA